MARASGLIALALVVAMGCATLPKLQRGVPYLVVWGYGVGPDGPVAYREIIIIVEFGPDGWVYARSPNDARIWASRLSNALSLTRLPETHIPQLPAVESYQSQK